MQISANVNIFPNNFTEIAENLHHKDCLLNSMEIAKKNLLFIV